MKKLTSLFDFFERVKRDKKYEKLATYAYSRSGWSNGRTIDYKVAETWIEKWIKENTKDSCKGMVDYLNKCMSVMPEFYDELQPPISPALTNPYQQMAANVLTQQQMIQQEVLPTRNVEQSVTPSDGSNR